MGTETPVKWRAVGTHVGTGRSSGGSEFGPTGATGSATEAGSSGLPNSLQWRLEASLGTEQPLVKCKQGSLGRIFAQCTFPDDRHPPTSLQQLVPDPPVPLHVGPEFRLPEVRSGSGIGRVGASFMTVPEAAMHETDRSKPGEHQVRPAGELAIMKTVPVAARVQRTPEDQFGLRVLAADSCHHSRPYRSINYVGHELVCIEMRGRDCMRISQNVIEAIKEDRGFVDQLGRVECVQRKGHRKASGDRLEDRSQRSVHMPRLTAPCSQMPGSRPRKALARCRPTAVNRP